jgi:integrase
VQALNTQHVSVARSRASIMASQLDSCWAQIRLAHADLPGKHLLKQKQIHAGSAGISSTLFASVSLKEALDLYLERKGANKGRAFRVAAERACGYLVDVAGLKDLHEYTRQDALSFRDFLIGRGLVGSSVTRVLNSVSAVYNFACSELALDLRNPFQGLYHDRSAGVTKRLPISDVEIRKIQAACYCQNDDCRWLIALISDTGLRLSEAAGLLISDIHLSDPVPYVVITPNLLRPLKTSGSERVVPLVGASLWAAERVREANADPSSPAFPRYAKSGQVQANSASAALNKWLKGYVSNGGTIHSFRHSMRDRLRAVECPSEMVDQIGGWSRGSVGQGYGSGYPLDAMHRYLSKIIL